MSIELTVGQLQPFHVGKTVELLDSRWKGRRGRLMHIEHNVHIRPPDPQTVVGLSYAADDIGDELLRLDPISPCLLFEDSEL